MTTTAIVWLVVGLLTVTVVLAMLIAFIRHLILLMRTLGRFQSELTPIAQEISELADQASARSRRARRQADVRR